MQNLISSLRNNRHAALCLLMLATAVLLLAGLGQREVWGAETRWANIALQMLQTHDYFDPYLKGSAYYDKPLPSYWVITATAWLMGGLDHWSLRLASVVAGWLSVWLVHDLGVRLYNRRTGLLAGWLLATTFYFVFWARVATADILTVFGVLAALWWYWRGPEDTRLSRYAAFFAILALTSLFKGLIGFILPGLLLLPHVLADGRFKRHLNLRLVAGLAVGASIYAVPFVLTHMYGAPTYSESGLGLVFRENVVRFFKPFDNFGPIYTYLVYLPVYTLPWAPCWILGLVLALKNWKITAPNVRWLIWGLALLFAFFTASGSRRSYYVLPLVPFAQLLGAWWLDQHLTRRHAAGKSSERHWQRGIAAAAVILLLVIGVFYPWSNGGGIQSFARQVRIQASGVAPWQDWRLVMIEVDNKLPIYMQQAGGKPFYYVPEDTDFPRDGTSEQFWAWLEKRSGEQWDRRHTIVLAQFHDRHHLPLAYLGADHTQLLSTPSRGDGWAHNKKGGSVAYLLQ